MALLHDTLYATVSVLMFVANLFFRRFQLTGTQPSLSSALIVLPGMILDTFVILFFSDALPN
ncbi:MAG: DUF5367 family protein, partial [Bacteroidota bacterium]